MTHTFYVTTPIYYVNDRPHIGHVYTTTLADVLARHHRLRGEPAFFLTGTDEHATKVVDSAREHGVTTQEWADKNAQAFRDAFTEFGIDNDDFIRTTEERHKSRVLAYVGALLQSGDVYLGEYEGWYDAGQEEYVPDKKAKDQDFKSAINKKPLVRKKERNYFFKLTAYAEELIGRIERDEFRVVPEARKNEILARLRGTADDPLRDVVISRTGVTGWGIGVPGDPEHTIYVWIDALLNYLTTVDTPERRAAGCWPADVQFVGKDILWFHAGIWPALLLALQKVEGYGWVELPRVLYAHSFWTSEGQKMSKSLGNFVDLEKLREYASAFGLDALRYFLLTQGPLGTTDGDFSHERFVDVYNAHLANTLGNCVSRVATMTQRTFGGKLPAPGPEVEGAPELRAAAARAVEAVRVAVDEVALDDAVEAALALVREVDGFIERTQPFKLAKDEARRPEVATVLYHCAEALRIASLLLWPVLPGKVSELWAALGQGAYTAALADRGGGKLDEWSAWGGLAEGTAIEKAALFPRYQPPKVEGAPPKAKEPKAKEPNEPKAKEPKPAPAPAPGPKAEISYEEFAALDLRVARVLEAAAVPKADKLLQLTLQLADGETRTVLSGIRAWYEPEALVGRQVIYLANLAPRKIRGVVSQGMVLAANDADGSAVLLQAERGVPDGSKVS
ncbi:MAG: methionine--tRNA ligase [Planctomycetota bacterium]